MQRAKPPSKRERVRNFLSRTFRLGPPAVPNAPQSLLDSGTPRVENPIDGTHNSPSPPFMQTRHGDLNMTELNDAGSSPSLHTKNLTHHLNMTSLTSGSSPSPPEITCSPLVNGTHTSPHVDARVGGVNITSSSPPPMEPHAVHVANTGTNIFPGAHHLVLKKPVFNVQGESNTVVQGINALSKRVIEGAEYDSSLRDPPPQCHPGTRVEFMKNILAWFRNREREKALLWLSGPVGVGKSAVIQTVAESLAESNSIGATLFFSRLNNRNDPQRVFITVAYQVATRIPTYRIYITERIALDPNLLGKGMRDQFRILIAEPFGNNGIRKGEGTWAVDCHINCESVASSGSLKYLFKYMQKGTNLASVEVKVNEIKQHMHGCYISASEAIHHIFHFNMHEQVPNVVCLQVHFPGKHMVVFNPEDDIETVQLLW